MNARALPLVVALLLPLATPVGAQPASPGVRVHAKGELRVVYADDPERDRFELTYEVRDEATGRVWELDFRGEPPDLRSGAIIAVRGYARDGRLVLGAAEGDDTGIDTLVPAAEPAVASAQRVLVIAGDFRDAALSCTPGAIAERVFDSTVQQSVDDLYREMTFYQVGLTGTVVGSYPIDYDSTSCSYSSWGSALDAEAQARGVDLSAYDRRVYVLPPNACGWAGYGTFGGRPSRAWIFRCDRTGTYAHEIGHNVGMHHASTASSEYGDTSDIMGASSPMKHVNAPHKAQLGWLPSSQVLPVTSSGRYEIAALEVDPGQAVAAQALKIGKPDTSEFYYLSYRQPAGFDANLSTSFLQGTSVHRYRGSGTTPTYLLDTLLDGERFVDAVNGIAVTQVAHTSATVTVDVALDATCSPATPVMSLSPSLQSGAPGAALSYTVSLRNADGGVCPSSTFSLAPTAPTGWGASSSPAALTLAPGQTSSAVLTVTSPFDAADGESAAFRLEVSDGTGAGHVASAGGTYEVVADREAPSAPMGLAASVRRLRVSLSWAPAADDVGVVAYSVLRGGVAVGSSDTTAYVDAAPGEGTYDYTVVAYDAAGNASAPSDALPVLVGGGGKTRPRK